MAKRVTTLSLSDEAREALELKANDMGKSMSGYVEWIALGENTVNDIFTDKANREYFFKMRKEYGASYLNRLVEADRKMQEAVWSKPEEEPSDEPAPEPADEPVTEPAEAVEAEEEPEEESEDVAPAEPVEEVEKSAEKPAEKKKTTRSKKPRSTM